MGKAISRLVLKSRQVGGRAGARTALEIIENELGIWEAGSVRKIPALQLEGPRFNTQNQQ